MAKILVPDARDFPITCDLLIVGGGVIGAATAFFAGRAGLKSIVVEKREALGQLTTSASLASVRAQFAEPQNIALMQESISVFEHFHDLTGGEIDFHQRGYLFLTTAPDGPEVFRARVEAQRAHGLEGVEWLSGEQARARFPFLSPEITAATFRARDGWLSAHELTYGFARASGATFFLDTPVTGWRIHSHRITGAVTPRGEIHTAQVVLAAGPFSVPLGHMAGVTLPLENIRRQRLALKQHPRIPRDAPMVVDLDTGAHWHPDGSGAVFGWALPEPSSEPLEFVAPDWEFPAVVLDGVARLSPFWNEIIPMLRRSDLSLVAGQYTETPDANPLIGALPELEGFYVSTGYGGHGVMASAGGARLLIDLITGKMKEEENPFRATRFAGGDVPRGEKMIL